MVDALGFVTNRRWLCGQMIGLVMAVVFVAHDVAMARAVPALPAQHAHSGPGFSHRSHDRPKHHGVDIGLHTSDIGRGNDDSPRVTHPSRQHGNCGIAPDVVTVGEGTRRNSERARSAAIDIPGEPVLSVAEMRRDVAPTWSPTVRRALLQVYRI